MSTGGVRLRWLGILIAFALVPLMAVGFISLFEMNQASNDVQHQILNLSTSLNRSALMAAPDDADQVQLAAAKALQFDEFFKRIKADSKLVAGQSLLKSDNDSCKPPGIWIAPIGSNQTNPMKRAETIRSLCAPARMMETLSEADPFLLLSYVGTEDGVLVTWPLANETLSNAAPFGYKDTPEYVAARERNETIWTGPFVDEKGLHDISITTPIFQGDDFFGVVRMDISLETLSQDLSSMKGRGYPFIIDSSGRFVMRPQTKPTGAIKPLLDSESLMDANSTEAKALVARMLKGKPGSYVIGVNGRDCYVAYAPIKTLGWSFGIAYPAEEMSLPARFIDSGIRDVAKSATEGLSDAYKTTMSSALLIFVLAASFALASGIFLLRRIDREIDDLTAAAKKISRGEFDVEVKPSGELSRLAMAFNEMAGGLKDYAFRLEGDAEARGGSGKEMAFLKGIKSSLVPGEILQPEGYEISARFMPSEKSGFDLYDVMDAGSENKMALTMAGVGGDGLKAAMLAMMARVLIRASPDKREPIKAISELNTQIIQHAQGMNLACFYALLDPEEGTLEYVNAGFNPPFIVDGGGMVDTLGGGGLALGMLEKMELKIEKIPIQQDDVLVVYSSGMTDAANGFRKQFGIERLINTVISNRNLSASEIIESVLRELGDFLKNQPIESDITLMIIKRT
ncbi:MAG: Stage II sporulation protein E (SpoIIE) [Methanosaeta sp. PtaU1.Bin060]|nr:MAG: Stage II sporulation protein E (SpoIIE) [Methanosaeta sp. PtaU1.Bin060]